MLIHICPLCDKLPALWSLPSSFSLGGKESLLPTMFHQHVTPTWLSASHVAKVLLHCQFLNQTPLDLCIQKPDTVPGSELCVTNEYTHVTVCGINSF